MTEIDGDSLDVLTWLQIWYGQQCDGDWEHTYGVDIGTLDNPGWTIEINLSGTDLESKNLEREKSERSEDDWLHVWTEGGSFHAACGPTNLGEALDRFRRWAIAPS